MDKAWAQNWLGITSMPLLRGFTQPLIYDASGGPKKHLKKL
jgi:hypothetical protein